jgi:hypothetical protein
MTIEDNGGPPLVDAEPDCQTPPTPGDPDELLTEKQAAAFMKFTCRFLQARRYRGGGPVYVRVSPKAVRYRKRDLITWAQERRQTSTADEREAAP